MNLKRDDLVFIALALGIYLLAGSSFSYWYSHNTKANLLADVDQRLAHATGKASRLLDPGFHDRLLAGAPVKAGEHQANTLMLQQYSQHLDCEKLFTVALQDGRLKLCAANWPLAQNDAMTADLKTVDYAASLASGQPLHQTIEYQGRPIRLYGQVLTTPGGRRYLACAGTDVGYMASLLKAQQHETILIILAFTLLALALTMLHRRIYLAYSARLAAEHRRHKSAEEIFREGDALLRSVSRVTQQFLNPADWTQEVNAAIRILGESASLSRVQIFKNQGETPNLRFEHRFEWVAPGHRSLEFPAPGGIRYGGLGLGRLSECMHQGDSIIVGCAAELSESEQVLMERYNIKAVILMPIMTAGHWWGFISFEDCEMGRVWSETEIFALHTAVSSLGAALERKHAEEAIKLNEARLETLLNLNLMSSASIEELVQFTLWQQVKLTGSELGYIALLDDSENLAAVHLMSANQIRIVDPASAEASDPETPWQILRRRRQPLIVNEYLEAPKRIAAEPERFIHREVNIPLLDAGRLTVIAGVANSPRPYREADITQLNLLIQGMWRLLQRRQAEAEHLRLVKAVEQAAETIVITDAHGVILYCNPAFAKLCGYSRDEVRGRLAQSFVVRDGQRDLGDVIEEIQQSIRVSGFWQGLTLNRRSDGSTFPVENTVSPVQDADGRLVNYVAVQRDVSHERDLETQLRQAQKMEAIGTLAGGIAHDFNNILSAILGYTELAMHDLAEDSRTHQRLREVHKAGLRAGELVKQILTFSREGEHERKPIRLQPVIEEALKLLRGTIPTTIAIEAELDRRCGLVMADPTRIHQVVMNLCTNAYHAMGSGGRMRIELKECAVSEADGLIGLKPGRCVCLSVTDSGSGMDARTIERIFEPYFTTKAPSQGTGLGLATVHGIVTSHEGAIRVESAPGAGSTFAVYLPLIAGEARQDSESILRPELLQGHEHILFVDDEQALVELEQQLLEDLGYRVSAFCSSRDALTAFRSDPDGFDLVITDQTMPGLTGLELAEALLEIRPGIPIILCSGFSESLSRERLERLGVRLFLPKPVIATRLTQALREILDADERRTAAG
ncbi:MAG: Blue-light-activated protein [Deltaproteobacteria bacterium ADurb.Bin510]|nr:MAG: Blue-light-activated protein [Deltaproteobacteria bacterium ADurb.Bin510]